MVGESEQHTGCGLAAVADAELSLAENGRVLLRKSGTESLVRVMVEAQDEHTAAAVANDLADLVRQRLSL